MQAASSETGGARSSEESGYSGVALFVLILLAVAGLGTAVWKDQVANQRKAATVRVAAAEIKITH